MNSIRLTWKYLIIIFLQNILLHDPAKTNYELDKVAHFTNAFYLTILTINACTASSHILSSLAE